MQNMTGIISKWAMLAVVLTLPVGAGCVSSCDDAGPDSGPLLGPDVDPPGQTDGGLETDAGVQQDADAGGSQQTDDGGVLDAGQVSDAGLHADGGSGMQPEADAGMTSWVDICFGDITSPESAGPEYTQFDPVIGTHCFGSQLQTYQDIERVVFLGDSVTEGTPETDIAGLGLFELEAIVDLIDRDHFYRNILADYLVDTHNLEAPDAVWRGAPSMEEAIGGFSWCALVDDCSYEVRNAGDFANCAKWGGRTDDLHKDNSQVDDCIPEEERNKKHLVIFTIGGNDIADITKKGAPCPDGEPNGDCGVSLDDIWTQTQEFIEDMRNAVEYLKDPQYFPAGVDVLFGNMYEFTDATGDVGSCAAASLAGFDEPWENPQDLEDVVVWANEQFMEIAVSTGSDMIFMLEHFCGHGFHNDDPENRCYRGPDSERWFDDTCTHPNTAGHAAIADMFQSVMVGGPTF
jgi:hypothetical protein